MIQMPAFFGKKKSGSTTDPAPTPSSVTYTMAGSTTFHTLAAADRKTKLGKVFTTTMNTNYNRFLWWLQNPSAQDSRVNMRSMAATGDQYAFAKPLRAIVVPVLHAFRFTGDLRILDEIHHVGELMESQLQVRTGNDGNGNPYSPYRCWVDSWNSLENDKNRSSNPRAHGLYATIGAYMNANRTLTSPLGKNYGALADRIKNYCLNDYEPKWTGGTGGWRDFYKGYYSGSSTKRITTLGQLPFINAGGAHSWHSNITYFQHMYNMTGEQRYLTVRDYWAKTFASPVPDGQIQYFNVDGIKYMSWSRGMTHDPDTKSPNYYAQPSTYHHNIRTDQIECYLDAVPMYNLEFMKISARSQGRWMMVKGTSGLARDVNGSHTASGVDVPIERGEVLATKQVDWDDQNRVEYLVDTHHGMAPWDDTGKIRDLGQQMYALQTTLHHGGSIEQPKSPFVAIYSFIADSL